ncbi:hypothetical protein HYQ45_012144 [Verticillium longisporum]|uniref:Uncharacterized protein n=1 Tax=Verticillium longisporum TaxID=100787 RepID=A0A8I2ZGC6_VERLO|nr:hypothetical protein HYQ45_012144 [Verticillium longisporum]
MRVPTWVRLPSKTTATVTSPRRPKGTHPVVDYWKETQRGFDPKEACSIVSNCPVSDLSIGPGPTNDTSGSCIQSGLALLSASEQPMGDMTEHSCPGQWPSTTGFAQMANADHPWPEAGKHLRVNKDS